MRLADLRQGMARLVALSKELEKIDVPEIQEELMHQLNHTTDRELRENLQKELRLALQFTSIHAASKQFFREGRL